MIFLLLSANGNEMKKFIVGALILGLSSCGVAPAFANAAAMQIIRNASVPSFTGYDSPECIFTMEGDEDKVRTFVIKKLETQATKNQKMLLDDLSFQDVLVAGQQVYCEGLSVPKALNWIGL